MHAAPLDHGSPRQGCWEMRDLEGAGILEEGVLWGKRVLERWVSPGFGAPTGEEAPWDRE